MKLIGSTHRNVAAMLQKPKGKDMETQCNTNAIKRITIFIIHKYPK